MKRCPKCDTQKDESEFSKDKSKCDGLQSYCKPCDSKRQVAWIKTKQGSKTHKQYQASEQGKTAINAASKKYKQTERGREKKRAYERKRYRENLDYYRLKNIARKSNGATVAILRQVRERDKVCQLCKTDKDLQFDHIWPVSLGGLGTLKNLQLLCEPCNSFKSNNLFLPGGGMLVTPKHCTIRMLHQTQLSK